MRWSAASSGSETDGSDRSWCGANGMSLRRIAGRGPAKQSAGRFQPVSVSVQSIFSVSPPPQRGLGFSLNHRDTENGFPRSGEHQRPDNAPLAGARGHHVLPTRGSELARDKKHHSLALAATTRAIDSSRIVVGITPLALDSSPCLCVSAVNTPHTTPSSFFKISSTSLGFALPAESFITAPLSALIALALPAFTCSADLASCAIAVLHHNSSSPVSVD